jgi:hypothetical protein
VDTAEFDVDHPYFDVCPYLTPEVDPQVHLIKMRRRSFRFQRERALAAVDARAEQLVVR